MMMMGVECVWVVQLGPVRLVSPFVMELLELKLARLSVGMDFFVEGSSRLNSSNRRFYAGSSKQPLDGETPSGLSCPGKNLPDGDL